ncbi:paralemmin-2-like [Scleropages formosus]|uniref:paralemmin-2-like n=1 Tax=Scleropages formosus TaxID=113540 RepID=UPI00087874BF|nr:paralemmin-2-like [Scleropages formosus]
MTEKKTEVGQGWRNLHLVQDYQAPRVTFSKINLGFRALSGEAAVPTMETNVQTDRKTGDINIVFASALSPEDAHQHSMKINDDEYKVFNEVLSEGSAMLGNNNNSWNSSAEDNIMQPISKCHDQKTASSYLMLNEQTVYEEIAPGTMLESEQKVDVRYSRSGSDLQVPEMPEVSSMKHITMIPLGYHCVENKGETQTFLGFNDTIKADIVHIDDDDDERTSLREKTVTDVSTMGGNAAELVSGQCLQNTTELSTELKNETLEKELPAAGNRRNQDCHCCNVM